MKDKELLERYDDITDQRDEFLSEIDKWYENNLDKLKKEIGLYSVEDKKKELKDIRNAIDRLDDNIRDGVREIMANQVDGERVIVEYSGKFGKTKATIRDGDIYEYGGSWKLAFANLTDDIDAFADEFENIREILEMFKASIDRVGNENDTYSDDDLSRQRDVGDMYTLEVKNGTVYRFSSSNSTGHYEDNINLRIENDECVNVMEKYSDDIIEMFDELIDEYKEVFYNRQEILDKVNKYDITYREVSI